MTTRPNAPDPHAQPLAEYGKAVIMVPLIIGGAVIIAAIMLFETHARNQALAEMCDCEERVRLDLRGAYAAMRALDPDTALQKTANADRLMRLLKTAWPSDYAELRIAMLCMEGEALMMKNAAANSPAAEERFDEALKLMSYSSGELWVFALLGIAQARIEQGKYDEAIADLGLILARNRNFGTAYYWRSLAKRKIGDEPGALEDEKRARNLDSWPPLRDFMQAANVYTRDILCKPDDRYCPPLRLAPSEERLLAPASGSAGESSDGTGR